MELDYLLEVDFTKESNWSQSAGQNEFSPRVIFRREANEELKNSELFSKNAQAKEAQSKKQKKNKKVYPIHLSALHFDKLYNQKVVAVVIQLGCACLFLQTHKEYEIKL